MISNRVNPVFYRERIVSLCNRYINATDPKSPSQELFQQLLKAANASINDDVLLDNIFRFYRENAGRVIRTGKNDLTPVFHLPHALAFVRSLHQETFAALRGKNKLTFLPTEQINELYLRNPSNLSFEDENRLKEIIAKAARMRYIEKQAANNAMQQATLLCYAFLQGRTDSASNVHKLPLDVIKIILSYLHPISTDPVERSNFANNVSTFFSAMRSKIQRNRDIDEFVQAQDWENVCSIS